MYGHPAAVVAQARLLAPSEAAFRAWYWSARTQRGLVLNWVESPAWVEAAPLVTDAARRAAASVTNPAGVGAAAVCPSQNVQVKSSVECQFGTEAGSGTGGSDLSVKSHFETSGGRA